MRLALNLARLATLALYGGILVYAWAFAPAAFLVVLLMTIQPLITILRP